MDKATTLECDGCGLKVSSKKVIWLPLSQERFPAPATQSKPYCSVECFQKTFDSQGVTHG
jgi:hypothetical protein